MIRRSIFIVTISLSLSATSYSATRDDSQQAPTFDTEGCTGDTLHANLEYLQGTLPLNAPPLMFANCDDGGCQRCDGGSIWMPFMINRDRALLIKTFPSRWGDGTDGTKIAVSVKNICTQDVVAHSTFDNYHGSPDFHGKDVWMPADYVDYDQPIFAAQENQIYMDLNQSNGVSYLDLYSWDGVCGTPQNIDHIPLEVLNACF